MKKFRKILQTALSILMAFVLVFAMGCEGCAGGSDGDGSVVIKPAPEKPAPTFELNESQIECIVGDVNKLSPKSLPDIGQAKLTWRSENSNVVTVDSNGNIEAISEGTAKVIATYGTVSASCTIKVSWDDEMPQIVSPANSDGQFSIVVGQEYVFSPTIQYRGKIYNDGQLSIAVSDPAVTSLDGNVITGEAKGASNVTISGTWRGRQALMASFNVKVSDNVTLSVISDQLEGDRIEIFTSAKSFKNTSEQLTSVSFVPSAKVQADLNSDPILSDMNTKPNDFSVVIADNIVSFNKNNKTLRATSFGDTIATIRFNYDGQTYVKQIFIHAERPVATLNKEVKYFSSLKGTLRDELNGFSEKTLQQYIYGNDTTVIKTAFIDDQELQVDAQTGAILGVTGPSNEAYVVVMRVGTDVEQYDVVTKVYGQYVYEVTDLDVFVRTAASPELNVYVELGRDLDVADYVKPAHFNDIVDADDPNAAIKPNHKWDTNRLLAKGFMGTFNGNGHYIMNVKQSGGFGFFEGLYEATIKNVAFVNCETADTTFMACFAKDVVMENVYIKMDKMAKSTNYWPVGVITNMYSIGGTYKNVYIDTQEANLSVNLPEGKDRWYWEVYSGFVTFPYATSISQPKFENCLLISKAPVSSMGFVSYSEGPRFVVAENMPEADRVKLRQSAWNAQTEKQQNDMRTFYKSKFNADTLDIFPNFNDFEATDPSLYFEHYNNNLSSIYGSNVEYSSLVGRVSGVRSYQTTADMQSDETINDYLTNFSSEFWTVVDGQLNWGRHPANLVDGDVLLDVGEVAGKPVQGINSNPLKNYKAGDKVQIGAISCFGYIFDGWKNAATGEMIELVGGKYTFTYNGKATILIAQWKLDPNVQVNSGNK